MKPFGWELCIDLYGCDLKKIKSRRVLKQFIEELCNTLKVKRFGKPVMKRYGHEHLTGYSIMQLIEVSSIIGHFSEERCSAHIDVFSCAEFDIKIIEDFAKQFFGATSSKSASIIRD
jgi:S-adenosylmethionine/arginine decarboxylase-like enzyme